MFNVYLVVPVQCPFSWSAPHPLFLSAQGEGVPVGDETDLLKIDTSTQAIMRGEWVVLLHLIVLATIAIAINRANCCLRLLPLSFLKKISVTPFLFFFWRFGALIKQHLAPYASTTTEPVHRHHQAYLPLRPTPFFNKISSTTPKCLAC